MQRELNIGDEVFLDLDPLMLGVTPGMLKWDGCIFRISKTVYQTDMPKATGRKGIVYYELEGCKSEKGIPYAILREWVHPISRAWR